jgi:hypothetical protein
MADFNLTCTSIPHVPQLRNTSYAYCTIESRPNVTNTIRDCFHRVNNTKPAPAVEAFTNPEEPWCEFVYVNITQGTSQLGFTECWREKNKNDWIPIGCYSYGVGYQWDDDQAWKNRKKGEGAVVNSGKGWLLSGIVIFGVVVAGLGI